MASVNRNNEGEVWIASITLGDGRRTRRSTKTTDRVEAQRIADEMEAKERAVKVPKPEPLIAAPVLGLQIPILDSSATEPSIPPAPKDSRPLWVVAIFGSFEAQEGDARKCGAMMAKLEAWYPGSKWPNEDETGRLVNPDHFVKEVFELGTPEFKRWVYCWYLKERERIFEYPYLSGRLWMNRLKKELVGRPAVTKAPVLKASPTVATTGEFEPAF